MMIFAEFIKEGCVFTPTRERVELPAKIWLYNLKPETYYLTVRTTVTDYDYYSPPSRGSLQVRCYRVEFLDLSTGTTNFFSFQLLAGDDPARTTLAGVSAVELPSSFDRVDSEHH
jgi:hypothetical protein